MSWDEDTARYRKAAGLEPDWEPSMDPDFDLYAELIQIEGVTEKKASALTERYRNLPTLACATHYDEEYLRDDLHISPEYLRDQLQDHDLYTPYTFFPERVIVPEDAEWSDIAIEGVLPADQSRLGDYDREE